MELSIEAYINKLSAKYKRTKAPHHFYLLDPKCLKLSLRAKHNVALA
jgi:hypothetical protein